MATRPRLAQRTQQHDGSGDENGVPDAEEELGVPFVGVARAQSAGIDGSEPGGDRRKGQHDLEQNETQQRRFRPNLQLGVDAIAQGLELALHPIDLFRIGLVLGDRYRGTANIVGVRIVLTPHCAGRTLCCVCGCHLLVSIIPATRAKRNDLELAPGLRATWFVAALVVSVGGDSQEPVADRACAAP